MKTKYLIYNDIDCLEELNDLKLIEEIQHGRKIMRKNTREVEIKKIDDENAKIFDGLGLQIKLQEIHTDKKLIIQLKKIFLKRI
jgi:hypothetical protein